MAQEDALSSPSEARARVAGAEAAARRRGESWLTRRARSLVLGRLEGLAQGRLSILEGGETRRFGTLRSFPLEGTVLVHHPAFWERLAWGGSIGAGEAFCQGLWSTPDLVSVVRVFARNQEALRGLDSGAGALAAPARRLLHRLRSNTRSGSRRNIAAHYDTGNELFAQFLDPTLTYSCAIFPDATSSLETAQQWKLDTICRKLELTPDDHLLEIGTGWGGLALHAARKYGCRVTTTTISRRQFEYASRAVREAGLAGTVTVLASDYRDLLAHQGRLFDKLVSVEMIEAVGHRYLPRFFEVIDRMLAPDGLALLQAIVVPDQRYEAYRRSVDFIQRYIFPGGFLPSVGRILECVGERTDMRLLELEDLTPHYARTLAAWSGRFAAREAEIAALGLSENERRKWQYYFGYCEGGFRERVIGDVQLLFAKPLNRREARPGSFV